MPNTQASPVDIYSFPTFNLTKVLLTAEEAEAPYRLHLLDASKGEHKTPEHLARHPLGKVPVVTIDGEHFFESAAICRLLAERYQLSLYGNDAAQRARTNQWMDLLVSHIGRWITAYFWQELIKPKLLNGEPDRGVLDEAQGFLAEQLPVLEAQLQNHDYIVNDNFSLADIMGFSYFDICASVSLDISGYPNITSWVRRISERPSYINAMKQLPAGSMFAVYNQ